MARAFLPIGGVVSGPPNFVAPLGVMNVPHVPVAYDIDIAENIGVAEVPLGGIIYEEDVADSIGIVETSAQSTTLYTRSSTGASRSLAGMLVIRAGQFTTHYTNVRISTGAASTYASVAAARQGSACVCFSVGRISTGRGRASKNATEGYVAWVATGGMPDLGAEPSAFSATLPMSFGITPPISGVIELWVILRRQNKYGLRSQNSQPFKVLINSSGDRELGHITAPQILNVITIEGDKFRVLAYYPGYYTDANPADQWCLFAGEDTYEDLLFDDETLDFDGEPLQWGFEDLDLVASTPITDEQMTINTDAYPEGGRRYTFVLKVLRTEDDLLSDYSVFHIDLPDDPAVPTPQFGEFLV